MFGFGPYDNDMGSIKSEHFLFRGGERLVIARAQLVAYFIQALYGHEMKKVTRGRGKTYVKCVLFYNK